MLRNLYQEKNRRDAASLVVTSDPPRFLPSTIARFVGQAHLVARNAMCREESRGEEKRLVAHVCRAALELFRKLGLGQFSKQGPYSMGTANLAGQVGGRVSSLWQVKITTTTRTVVRVRAGEFFAGSWGLVGLVRLLKGSH